jgi:hypothetical protein
VFFEKNISKNNKKVLFYEKDRAIILPWERSDDTMTKTKKTILTISIILLSLVLIFAGAMVYAAFDYVNRCVHIDPREDVDYLASGMTYDIDDLFVVKRADETVEYIMTASWSDGSVDGLEISEDMTSITIAEGKGELNISLSAHNEDSPEWMSDDITVGVR